MPYVTRSLAAGGAVVELLVGVNEARRQVLQRNGLPVPERIRVPAQIDTGTEYRAIESQVLRRLGIGPIDAILVRTPATTDAPLPFNQFAVSLVLNAEEIELFLGSVEVLECVFASDEGIQAMLGRDVLKHCLFVYDGQAGTFSLAF